MEDIHEPNDEDLSHTGRIIDSQLSEHQAEGWLEGYTLTGRHGFFATYESFGRVVDSMLTQHMKWLRKAKEQYWRHDYPALTFVDTSHGLPTRPQRLHSPRSRSVDAPLRKGTSRHDQGIPASRHELPARCL
jgi:hypothetical protein